MLVEQQGVGRHHAVPDPGVRGRGRRSRTTSTGEGLTEPILFVKELEGFSDEDVRKIMRDNALELMGAPAA
ncbi:hypothetical protein [Frankia sp. AgKG'84/4]